MHVCVCVRVRARVCVCARVCVGCDVTDPRVVGVVERDQQKIEGTRAGREGGHYLRTEKTPLTYAHG